MQQTFLFDEIFLEFLVIWNVISKEEIITPRMPNTIIKTDHMKIT
jgi:hypothetical protein